MAVSTARQIFAVFAQRMPRIFQTDKSPRIFSFILQHEMQHFNTNVAFANIFFAGKKLEAIKYIFIYMENVNNPMSLTRNGKVFIL
jgi:hypothetical protein